MSEKKLTSMLNEKQMVPNSLIITAVLPRAMQLLAIRNDFRLLTQSPSQSLDKLSVWFEGNLTIERRAGVRPSLEQELERGSRFFCLKVSLHHGWRWRCNFIA